MNARKLARRTLSAKRQMTVADRKKVVGVRNPRRCERDVLKAKATFHKHLRPNFVATAQFPSTLTDAASPSPSPLRGVEWRFENVGRGAFRQVTRRSTRVKRNSARRCIFFPWMLMADWMRRS